MAGGRSTTKAAAKSRPGVKLGAGGPSRFLLKRVAMRKLLGGIPDRTFTRLESEGIISPSERGIRGKPSTYDVHDVVPAYVAYLSAARPASADREARAMRDRTFAELNQLKLRRENGELVPRAQIVTEGQAFTKAIATMVRALPRRFRQAGLIEGEREAEITAVVRDVLVEISRWRTLDDLAAVIEAVEAVRA